MNGQDVQPSSKGKLIVIDDDQILADRMAKALERKGFEVRAAYATTEALNEAMSFKPDFAVIDLRLGRESGLDLVEKIREGLPNCRMVMLTAFGNIATAVAAVKAGAIDYIAKPADADTVERALLQIAGTAHPEPPEDPMTAERVRWEHILRIYEQCDRNVSETARRLKMHRRTLQRILAKYAPRDNETEAG